MPPDFVSFVWLLILFWIVLFLHAMLLPPPSQTPLPNLQNLLLMLWLAWQLLMKKGFSLESLSMSLG